MKKILLLFGVFGIASEPVHFVPLQIVREGVRIIPSIIYDHTVEFKKAIDLVVRDIIHPGWIVEETIRLSDFNMAFEKACSGKCTKLIIKMS